MDQRYRRGLYTYESPRSRSRSPLRDYPYNPYIHNIYSAQISRQRSRSPMRDYLDTEYTPKIYHTRISKSPSHQIPSPSKSSLKIDIIRQTGYKMPASYKKPQIIAIDSVQPTLENTPYGVENRNGEDARATSGRLEVVEPRPNISSFSSNHTIPIRSPSPYSQYSVSRIENAGFVNLEKIAINQNGTLMYTGGSGLHILENRGIGFTPFEIDLEQCTVGESNISNRLFFSSSIRHRRSHNSRTK